MNKLSIEEISKVFALYWGQKYQYKNEWGTYGDTVKFGYHTATHMLLNPLLHLMSLEDLSGEHIAQVEKMEVENMDLALTVDESKDLIIARRFDLTFPTFMYLISLGYDMPLYFEPKHWANTKTAIELGLAKRIKP